MYLEDLPNGFYKEVIKHKVLVLVNYDIDGICAAKILQNLFRYDNVVYILVPVLTVTDLATAYNEHKNDIKRVVLINCGGTIDIVDILEPEEDVVFFVADSHRPTDVTNIYSTSQIRILAKAEEEEGIPHFDNIFRDESSDDEDEESDIGVDDESYAERRGRLEEKRRNRRQWEEERDRIMFDYVEFTYYGRSIALLMFEISWKMHRDSVDLLWWAIVGISEQLILGKIEFSRYVSEVDKISAHAGRLCANTAESIVDQSTQSSSTASNAGGSPNTALRIDCQKDLQLALYRHWTVESSLRYTMYTALALKLWAIKGEKRLYQLLAEMGLPLVESKQQYSAMDLTLRKEFHKMMENMSDTHNLAQLLYPSFTLCQGFRTKYQAADYVYSMLAHLSNTSHGRTLSDSFYKSMDSLSRAKKNLLDDGIEKSKHFLDHMFRHVKSALEMKQVMSAGPYLYLVIQEGTLHGRYYTNPDCLMMLATFALRAHVSSTRKKNVARLPLVASAPLEENNCLVVGIPPMTETVPRSFFGRAFERAAEKAQCKVWNEYFDSTVVKMQTTDRPKFFDALSDLLS